jgi:uncharacterized repeat protein (TIGR01451 family)
MERRVLLATIRVTSAADSGDGTLRAALTGASSGDVIRFDIGPGGGQTISLLSALPAVTVPLTIDGTTQPGYAGTPLVVLDGTGAGAGVSGLTLAGGQAIVRGLAIESFSSDGIVVTSSNNTIGGSNAGQGNVISGNQRDGINITGGGTILSGNLIAGNLIGTDATGTLRLGNALEGIAVTNAASTTIGGTTAAARNVISANGDNGITTFGTTTGLLIQGNAIGTDITGQSGLGNGNDGVHLFSNGNTVGGQAPGAGNTIAFNGNPLTSTGAGVAVVANSSQNTILSNSIFSNRGLGISESGSGNNGQQPPRLSAANSSGTSTTISGMFGGAAGTTYRLEFFANQVADTSGAGQGQVLLGTAMVTTPAGNPQGTFSGLKLSKPVPAGWFISATATDANGNTSAFANDITADGKADVRVQVQTDATATAPGSKITYTITVTNNGPTPAHSVVVTDLLPDSVTLVSDRSPPPFPSAVITPGANSVQYDFGTLDVGDVATATIVVATSDLSTPQVTNSVVLQCPDEAVPGDATDTVTTLVGAHADLSVTAVAPTVVAPGQNITYIVTVTNNGPSQATGVTLTDTLPPNTIFLSAVPSRGTSTFDGNSTVTTAIGTLDPGSSPVTVTIVVATTAGTASPVTTTTSVQASETDQDPSNNTATATTTVVPLADLQVVLESAQTLVPVGQYLTYTLTATNHGVSPASGVAVTDTLPAGVTFVSATDSAGGTPTYSAATGEVTDALGTLDAQASVTITIVVTPTALASATITDGATVRANELDPDPTNNTATLATMVLPVTDLAVALQTIAATPDAGQQVTYSITVTNQGPSPATGVTLTDTLPASVTVVSVSQSQGDSAPAPGHTLVAAIGTLDAGASATLSIVVVTGGASVPAISNSVTVKGDQLDPTSSNNTASSTSSVSPSASLVLTVSPPSAPVLLGQDITFTVSLINDGPSPATGVSLTDTLPPGVTFVSATDGRGNTFTPSAGQLVDAIDGLDVGASVTLTIVVHPAAVGTFTNVATATADDLDDPPDQGQSTASATVVPASDLVVAVVSPQPRVTIGQRLTIVVRVSNFGPSPAPGVVLTDALPAGATLVAAGDSLGGKPTLSAGQIVDPLGTLASGASATLTIIVIPSIAGTTRSTALARAGNADPRPANNGATASVPTLDLPGTLQFAAAGTVVNENAGMAALSVRRTWGGQGTVAVHYSVIAGGTAAPGVDYQPVSGNLVFGPGETVKNILVPVLADRYDKHDETVLVRLSTPQGGAILGAQTTTLLVIRDLDPDNTPPVVTDVVLSGPATAITTITLYFSEPLDPASTGNIFHYLVAATGTSGVFGSAGTQAVGLRGVVYNPVGHAVTLLPTVPLGANVFFFVRAVGLTDRAGNALALAPGVAAGTGFSSYVARGTGLRYYDSHGALVTMGISGGGVMDLTRGALGEGLHLQVLNPAAGRTNLFGGVVGGRGYTTLSTMTGLGRFGQVAVNLRTPPFYVRQAPFLRSVNSAPAEDVVTPLPIAPQVGTGGSRVTPALARRKPGLPWWRSR